MNIHVIGTVNGEVNEGMRNIATHISHAFDLFRAQAASENNI